LIIIIMRGGIAKGDTSGEYDYSSGYAAADAVLFGSAASTLSSSSKHTAATTNTTTTTTLSGTITPLDQSSGILATHDRYSYSKFVNPFQDDDDDDDDDEGPGDESERDAMDKLALSREARDYVGPLHSHHGTEKWTMPIVDSDTQTSWPVLLLVLVVLLTIIVAIVSQHQHSSRSRRMQWVHGTVPHLPSSSAAAIAASIAGASANIDTIPSAAAVPGVGVLPPPVEEHIAPRRQVHVPGVRRHSVQPSAIVNNTQLSTSKNTNTGSEKQMQQQNDNGAALRDRHHVLEQLSARAAKAAVQAKQLIRNAKQAAAEVDADIAQDLQDAADERIPSISSPLAVPVDTHILSTPSPAVAPTAAQQH
jgi:hypothetical protein